MDDCTILHAKYAVPMMHLLELAAEIQWR